MGESRTELIQWVNDLLQVNYTKIEQCGTGAAYCQILDSIYGDVPMSRVKMNSKQEYEHLQNYKVLQNIFKTKKIDKPIPVDRLVKCKMQDNLEFVQWIRRFWDANYGGQPYDPVARRKGTPMEVPATVAPMKAGGLNKPAPSRGATGARTPLGGHRTGSAQSGQITVLHNQLTEMKATLEGLEKERDFYFQKLRDIEILVQERAPVNEEGLVEDELLKSVQEILYSTEDGFEAPQESEEETF